MHRQPPHRPRRVRLTDEVHERIVAAVRNGCTYETAARCAGIAVSTFRGWMAKGSRDVDGPYAQFADAVQIAEAEAHEKMSTALMAHAQGDYRAAVEFLKRRDPGGWGERKMVHVSDDPLPSVTLELSNLSDEELENLDDLLATAGAPLEADDGEA